MRNANALQRRRRVMLLQNGQIAGAPDVTQIGASDSDAAWQQFFHECGGRSGVRLLVEVAGEAHARHHLLDRPCTLIGSHPSCDIRIVHADVQPRHAYLQWIDGRVFCCGLGMDSEPPVATWLDRKPVTVGPFRLSVANVEPAVSASSDPQSRNPELAAEVPQIQLKFSGVEQQDNLWPVDRSLTLIGRGAQCKLRLDHPEIPIVLAGLVRTRTGCWLVNVSGQETLSANGHVVGVQSLDIGDILQLGPFQAEVTAAPFSLKTPRPAPASGSTTSASVRALAARHRQRLGALNKSLDAIQLYLDTEPLNAVPELKTAIQQYVLHAQRHHREMQDALERLSAGE